MPWLFSCYLLMQGGQCTLSSWKLVVSLACTKCTYDSPESLDAFLLEEITPLEDCGVPRISLCDKCQQNCLNTKIMQHRRTTILSTYFPICSCPWTRQFVLILPPPKFTLCQYSCWKTCSDCERVFCIVKNIIHEERPRTLCLCFRYFMSVVDFFDVLSIG